MYGKEESEKVFEFRAHMGPALDFTFERFIHNVALIEVGKDFLGIKTAFLGKFHKREEPEKSSA